MLVLKIKAILRKNPFYIRYCQRYVNDVRFFYKNIRLYISYFSLKKDKNIEGNTLYFVFDHQQTHPGLADRLKVICCAYYIAKINSFDFKIIFDTPFLLQDYLEPNKINWKGQWDDLSYSFKNARLLAYNGMGKIPHLNNKIKQYIIRNYIGKNILECNNIPNWEKIWRDCYNYLFKPSQKLLDVIQVSNLVPRKYIAVHLRFVNALEHFEDGYYNKLNLKRQEQLICKCLSVLYDLKYKEHFPIVVFSDSNKFLEIVKLKGFTVIEGNVGHISFNSDSDTVLKTFLDFYLIGQSKKAFRIVSHEMYNTTFSYYAALAGGATFETISI